MKTLLFLVSLALEELLLPTIAVAQQPTWGEQMDANTLPPKQVRIQLYCTKSFKFMFEYLKKEYQEEPRLLTHLSPTSSFVLFTNKDESTSTLVISKKHSGQEEEACILWTGKSEAGMSFSLNPAAFKGGVNGTYN